MSVLVSTTMHNSAMLQKVLQTTLTADTGSLQSMISYEPWKVLVRASHMSHLDLWWIIVVSRKKHILRWKRDPAVK